MQNYHQLTLKEREQISMLRQSKTSISKIALTMGRHKSTISREINRNEAPAGQYWPDTAQALSLKRRKHGSVLDRDESLKDFVMTQLCCHYWTPEARVYEFICSSLLVSPKTHAVKFGSNIAAPNYDENDLL